MTRPSRSVRRPPHIAHMLPWKALGGTEVATLRIARAVAGHGFRGTAFHLSDAVSVRDLFRDAGFATLPYESPEPSFRHPRAFLHASKMLAGEFRRRGVDLVHCADILSAYHTALAGRFAGVPVLCHVRNRYTRLGWRERVFLRPVHNFAFVSRDTWTHFGLRVPADRGRVVYDAVEVPPPGDREAARRDVRREFGFPECAVIIGMVARVAPQKDFGTLARAATRVVSVCPDVRFLLVGDCSSSAAYRAHRVEVERMLEAAGVRSRFVFTDLRHDVPRLLDAMDLFVLSTHWEGLPLVILEAMAHALPVVATAVDGVPEVVIDGRTGLLAAHENDAQLAEQLLSLLRDPDFGAELGRTARNHVAEHFGWDRFAREMAGLYREMLGIDGEADG